MAIGHAQFHSRSHDAVIHVYDVAGNVIEIHQRTERASNFFLLPNFFCYRTSMSVAPKETAKSSPTAMVSIEEIRRCFPALARTYLGHPVAYFDGPGGTQVPRAVVEAINDYLYHHNANTHWAYPTSAETDVIIDSARSVLEHTPGRVDDHVSLRACRISPMRIGVMVIKIIVDCFHHRPWHLGSTGSIEIGYRMTEISARKRRKTSSYLLDRHHRCGRRLCGLFWSN